jgi:hypothetical protein
MCFEFQTMNKVQIPSNSDHLMPSSVQQVPVKTGGENIENNYESEYRLSSDEANEY